MADPRTLKKYYMKVFHRNMELWKDFLEFYDEAVEEGSEIPEEMAMILFRERYREANGEWVRR